MGEAEYWTQLDAVRSYTDLSARCESLFGVTGALASIAEPPAAQAVLATASRHLGAHAARWAAFVPESVLLDDARRDAAVAADRAADGGADLDVAAAVEQLAAALEEVLERGASLADGAALRLARIVLDDLRDARRLLGSGWQPSRSGYR